MGTHTHARAQAYLNTHRYNRGPKLTTPQREVKVPKKRLNDITKTTQLDYERYS